MRVEPVEFGQAQGRLLGVGGVAGRLSAQALRLQPPLAPYAPGAAAGGQGRSAVAVAVQQGAVGARVQQADRGVLAVHLQQQGAQFTQHAHANRLVVDEGPRATVGGDLAAQHQRLARLGGHALVGQQDAGGMCGGQVEHRRRHGLGRAVAHQPRVAAGAAGQAQSVEHDGLAGPGLAGQGGQPDARLQVQRLDQHHVADVQADQHAGAEP